MSPGPIAGGGGPLDLLPPLAAGIAAAIPFAAAAWNEQKEEEPPLNVAGSPRQKPEGRLQVLNGRSEGEVFDLFKDRTYELGSSRKVAIPLKDPGISFKHAAVDFAGETFRVCEIRSNTGTSVNGTPLQPGLPQVLRHGDELGLGPVALRFTLIEHEDEDEQGKRKGEEGLDSSGERGLASSGEGEGCHGDPPGPGGPPSRG
ncbi:MAG: FHA domain-containing protein [Planctomycetota bacterium]